MLTLKFVPFCTVIIIIIKSHISYKKKKKRKPFKLSSVIEDQNAVRFSQILIEHMLVLYLVITSGQNREK